MTTALTTGTRVLESFVFYSLNTEKELRWVWASSAPHPVMFRVLIDFGHI